jgi:hypothetical protein
MLSSVLHSERAVKVNIAIMRAFVQLRQMLASNEQLCRKIEEMEKRYDAKFQIVFDAIKRMLQAPKPPHTRSDFTLEKTNKPGIRCDPRHAPGEGSSREGARKSL